MTSTSPQPSKTGTQSRSLNVDLDSIVKAIPRSNPSSTTIKLSYPSRRSIVGLSDPGGSSWGQDPNHPRPNATATNISTSWSTGQDPSNPGSKPSTTIILVVAVGAAGVLLFGIWVWWFITKSKRAGRYGFGSQKLDDLESRAPKL